MKILNNVFIDVIDARTREVLETRETHNLVMTSGLKWVRDLIGGTESRASKIALGTGATAATVSDSTLVTQVYEQAIDRRIGTLSPAKMTHKIFVGSADANGNDLSEVGLFRGSLLIARAVLSPAISKTDLVELTISHEITVS